MKKTIILFSVLTPFLVAGQSYDVNGDYKISGNVGIGTTSPNAQLQVLSSGISALFGSDANSLTLTNSTRKFARIGAPHYLSSEEPMAGFVFDSDGNNNIIWIGGGTNQFNTATELRFATASSATNQGSNNISNLKMVLKGSGNLGIGTSNPSSILQLSSTEPVLTIENSGSGDENQHEIFFKENDQVGMKINYNGSISGTLDRMEFIDRTGGIDNVRAIIQRNGNVGFGSTSPSSLVHLSSTAPVLTIENSGSGNENQHEVFFKENSSTGMKINYNGSISGPLDRLEFIDRTSGTDNIRAVFQRNGNVGIGTTSPQSKLSVDGQIRATEVKVQTDVNSVPDYVFEPDYELRTLKETKEYIAKNKHLPEIPSASEIGENGIDLGDMNMRLLKKIEELTLHQIELLERLEQLESKNNEIEELKRKVQLLENN